MPVQLPDGTVLLSIRNADRIKKRRVFSTSRDGISDWSEVRFEEEIFDPTCMASIVALPADKKNEPAILFVNPDSRDIEKHPRQNLTAKISYDGGNTWPVQKVLNGGPSGYSDLAVGPDGMIYCLYETNTVGKGFNYTLVLKRFDRNWLLK